MIDFEEDRRQLREVIAAWGEDGLQFRSQVSTQMTPDGVVYTRLKKKSDMAKQKIREGHG